MTSHFIVSIIKLKYVNLSSVNILDFKIFAKMKTFNFKVSQGVQCKLHKMCTKIQC